MNETPIELDGGQSKEDVRHGIPLSGICGNSTGSTIVCCNATNGAHVSWQWGEPRSPHPAGQNLLRKDAVQCYHAVLSWVSSPCRA